MIIDGKKIAQEIREEIAKKISQIKGRKPGLGFVLVGENPASQSYVRMKKKACATVGMRSTVIELKENISTEELLQTINDLNHNPDIDGYLVQMPLPKHLDSIKVIYAVDPEKDVDGFHPINIGKALLGEDDGFLPCTPNGIKIILEKSQVEVSGKHVVILGRSNIVGKPLAAILMQKKPGCNATVTIAHSQTANLKEICRSADILVAAIGKAHFVTADMVKKGAVVIDVGINRVNGKIVGDVDFEKVAKVTEKITPVPGGVGPMTIALLLQNTLKSFLKRANK